MKLIAYYLPQFHRIPENDRWWGEGFTEWTNTNKAKPLFTGHYQPRIPYQENYYDLTDPQIREWQAKLAKTYGIYGFCYYHYWFKGKKLLEKPFEQVLYSKKPDFPFCLSWANEPWSRRWNGANNDVLMPQDYGEKKDWDEHFNYLLTAFKDRRYIKINGKPLFIIYRPLSIPQCSKMLRYWQLLARKNGFNGIFFVETLNGFHPLKHIDGFDASIEFEPHYTNAHKRYINPRLKNIGKDKGLCVLSYDKIWRSILRRTSIRPKKKIFPGAFVDWDNTARRGKEALIFYGSTPQKFTSYLTIQIQNAKKFYNSEFLFINAWNEWAEGAYLEPDQKFHYQYLEGVKQALKNNGYF